MNWPQITVLVLAGLGALSEAYMHGKPKTGKHNIFTHIIATSISLWILWAGGFFK